MHILYPQDPLNPKQADTPYQAEYQAVSAAGLDVSLFDFDALAYGEFNPRPRIASGDSVLYRGWMLNLAGYDSLVQSIKRSGGIPVTKPDQYSQCHHLPGWYQSCLDFTAETHFFPATSSLRGEIEALGWNNYFVKDFVKSNTGGKGAIAQSLDEVQAIIEELELFRGEIEGGIAIRRVEDYLPDTEQRFFVVRGRAYAPTQDVPQLVEKVAERVDAPFYSVDLIQNRKGELRLVELGDGQVSDKKDWPLARFVEVIAAIAR